jgi:V/A-type H+-transporting ATPase subunit D
VSELVPTPSVLLGLREERAGMREGYQSLDEKRLVLAAELMAELERYQAARRRFEQVLERARAALGTAMAWHGLEGIQVHPPADLAAAALHRSERRVLGVRLREATLEPGPARLQWPPENPSADMDRTRDAFTELLAAAVELGAREGNLARLREEYQRTARRARALEDVLLPELDDTIADLETSLEDLELEDAIRVRQPLRQGKDPP